MSNSVAPNAGCIADQSSAFVLRLWGWAAVLQDGRSHSAGTQASCRQSEGQRTDPALTCITPVDRRASWCCVGFLAQIGSSSLVAKFQKTAQRQRKEMALMSNYRGI